MPNILIAWHGDESEEYFAKTALATPAEIEAAEAAFGSSSGFEEKPIYSINGAKGTLNISGPLSPNGPSALARFFGFNGTGYKQIIEATNAFKAAGVNDVEINGNSGGGYVDGCDQAYQAIFSLRDTAKVTFINRGMTASAMYYLASAATEILSDSISNFTGSIGVKVAAYDFKEYYEKIGIKERVIVSENASKKSPSISDESGRDEIKKQINSIERVFYQRISEGRAITTEKIKADFGQGAVMIAHDPDSNEPSALSNGLIDGIIGFSIENNSESGQAKAETIQNVESASAVHEVSKNLSGSTPAKEGIKMAKLSEILAADPEANADYKADVTAAVNSALNEANEKTKQNGALAKVALSAEKSYGATIRNLAAGLMAGENTAEELKSAMSSADAVREELASASASKTTQDIGATGAQDLDENAESEAYQANGIVSSQADADANIARLRKQNGVA